LALAADPQQAQPGAWRYREWRELSGSWLLRSLISCAERVSAARRETIGAANSTRGDA